MYSVPYNGISYLVSALLAVRTLATKVGTPPVIHQLGYPHGEVGRVGRRFTCFCVAANAAVAAAHRAGLELRTLEEGRRGEEACLQPEMDVIGEGESRKESG